MYWRIPFVTACCETLPGTKLIDWKVTLHCWSQSKWNGCFLFFWDAHKHTDPRPRLRYRGGLSRDLSTSNLDLAQSDAGRGWCLDTDNLRVFCERVWRLCVCVWERPGLVLQRSKRDPCAATQNTPRPAHTHLKKPAESQEKHKLSLWIFRNAVVRDFAITTYQCKRRNWMRARESTKEHTHTRARPRVEIRGRRCWHSNSQKGFVPALLPTDKRKHTVLMGTNVINMPSACSAVYCTEDAAPRR